MKSKNLLIAGALALSTVMTPVASMLTATPICAATISHPESEATENHTYEVYQVFTGDYENSTLSNLKWGINGTGTTGENVPDATVRTLTDAINKSEQEKLAAILKVTKLENPVAELTKDNPEYTNVAPGYYLIKDKDRSLAENANDAYTFYIVKVVAENDSITISPKSTIPQIDKQVQDEVADRDIQSTDNEGWGETADHDINEIFKFKVVASGFNAEEVNRYDSYKAIIHDEMSSGVDFVEDETHKPVIKINDAEITLTKDEITGDYVGDERNVRFKVDGKQITVTVTDLKKYSSTADEEYTIEVVYDAKLNASAFVGVDENKQTENMNSAYLEYSNNPNAEGTGQTARDEVFVATFKLNNLKVGADGATTLSGAGFKLTKVVNGTTYVANFDGNKKCTGWEEAVVEDGVLKNGTEITSGADGRFDMEGLDAGTYKLVETTVPDTYTAAPDTEVTISAEHKEHEFVIKSGSEITKVINTQSVNLPTTGGMGTTMIYGVGTLMAAGAAIVFVTNKRTRKD